MVEAVYGMWTLGPICTFGGMFIVCCTVPCTQQHGMLCHLACQPLTSQLLDASRDGAEPTVLQLLSEGVSMYARPMGRDGPNALDRAARCNQPAMIRLLVDKGMDVNAVDSEDWTPLMYCGAWGSVQAAQQLLDLGADQHLANSDSDSALAIAEGNKRKALVEVLRSVCCCGGGGWCVLVAVVGGVCW